MSLLSQHRQGDPALDLQPPENGVQVALHGRFTDAQLLSNVFVVKSQCDSVGDFQLPLGQAFQGRDRRGGVRQALQGPSGSAAIGPEFPPATA